MTFASRRPGAGIPTQADDRYGLGGVVADSAQLQRFARFVEPEGLAVGGWVTPNWMLDGASFWYAERAPEDTVILRVDGQTGEATPLFDVARTRAALTALLGRDLPYRGLPFDAIVELGGDRYRFGFEGRQYILSLASYEVQRVAAGHGVSKEMRAVLQLLDVDATNREVPRMYRRPMWLVEPQLVPEAPSPDRRWFASVRDGNVVLRSPLDDRTMSLTGDGTPDFAWDIETRRSKLSAGLEIGEHQLEPWSPDSTRLFAIKVDRRLVPTTSIVRYLKREEECTAVRMQRAGGPMDIAHPHVIDVLAKRARRLDLGNTEDQFITLIGWLPDGSEVLFTRHSRDFKNVEVLAGDSRDGTVRVVLAEQSATFVGLQHDVIYWGDNHATILPDGTGLIWRSARSGWNHFYLHGLDGKPFRALTQGEFAVIDVVAVDQERGWVYFTAHHDPNRPYDTHLCRVQLSCGPIERLTSLDGHNAVTISPQKKTFTAVNSRPDRPFRTDFHACDGKHLATLQRADVSGLDALGYVASEEFTVQAADRETVLWGVIHKPADFDPGKKYPIIDHLYGGPQLALVAHRFGLGEDTESRLDRALAQLGYIVVSVDARGTPERSKAFQDVVYGNWGRHEIADHVAMLRQLAQRHSFIDLERVGVWGHSWGGYFTIRALAQAPDVFHVGVASAPGNDPYDAILYEPYLDLPTRAKAAYDYADNYRWADRILGKLMMIVGTTDALCYSNTLEMVHYLIQAGVEHELVVIPGAVHAYRGVKGEEYFIRKLAAYFETHLKTRRREAASGHSE